MTDADKAYKLLQKLTIQDAPTNYSIDTWALLCVQALTDKVGVLELELSKLKVKNNNLTGRKVPVKK